MLKIHFNYKDKSIYVSGYGLLDARRVSSVVLEGDKLSILSGNVTYNWASSVSSASYKYVFQTEIPSIPVRIVLNHVMQVFVSIGK